MLHRSPDFFLSPCQAASSCASGSHCKFSAVSIESLRKKQWTRTGPSCLWACAARHVPPPRVNRIPILSVRVVPAAPLSSNSLSFTVWHEKASHPRNMFSMGKRPSSAISGHMFSSQGPTIFSISTRKEMIAPVRLAQLYVSALSLTVDLHKFLQRRCGPQMQPSPGCEVPAEQFWNNLGHLFHDTIDGTLYQSLPCRSASQQEDCFATDQTLAPLDRRKSAEVLDPTITQGSITPTQPLCTFTQRVPSSPHEGDAQ